MRVVGVDFGASRIGLAVGDSDTNLAIPREVIHRAEAGGAADEVFKRSCAIGAEVVVVGMPRTLAGNYGEQAEATALFIDGLISLGATVDTIDERLTTVEAERRLREAQPVRRGRRKSQQKMFSDASAAAVLLQSWLDSKRMA